MKALHLAVGLLAAIITGSCSLEGRGAGQALIAGHRVAYAFDDHDFTWIAVSDVTGDYRVVSGAGFDGSGSWSRVQVTTGDRDLVLEQDGRTLEIDLTEYSLGKGGLFFVAVDVGRERPYVQVRQLDVPLPALTEGLPGLVDTLEGFLEAQQVQRFLETSARELGSDFVW